jgi:hypothetical protein
MVTILWLLIKTFMVKKLMGFLLPEPHRWLCSIEVRSHEQSQRIGEW